MNEDIIAHNGFECKELRQYIVQTRKVMIC